MNNASTMSYLCGNHEESLALSARAYQINKKNIEAFLNMTIG